ncbi:MAG: HemK2/MTQ2 family protein methyltransferase [bacterium]
MKKSSYQIIMQWTLSFLHRSSSPYEINILGKKLTVNPGVYSPKLFNLIDTPTCQFLAANLMVNQNDEVLDLGTGTGIQAIFAADKAKSVIGTDINKNSIACAKENAKKNNVKNIEFIEGDLFEPVKGKKFDLIIWSPPTWPGKPKNHLESSWLCGNGELITRFFKNAANYLKDSGRIQFCINYNHDYFINEANKNGLNIQKFKHNKRILRNSSTIYFCTKRK